MPKIGSSLFAAASRGEVTSAIAVRANTWPSRPKHPGLAFASLNCREPSPLTGTILSAVRDEPAR
jgi:hypothetical protein